ncbi:MAG TPA: alpha/beta hydrolase [Bryobacteraceae bacterium]|nr:alpha/beta hydrolase [Bryobacteraceae bacterium]
MQGSDFVTTHDGIRLYYDRLGNGPKAVVIPLGFYLQEFRRLAAPDRTIILYDQRNRGRSTAIAPNKLTLADEVRDMETIRAHFGFAKFTPIGFSYLGLMVMLYAIDHPNRVERVVQLSPLGMRPDATYPPGEHNDDQTEVIGAKTLAELDSLIRSGYVDSHPREYCEKEWLATRKLLVGDSKNAAELKDYCEYSNEWPRAFRATWPTRLEEFKKLDFSQTKLDTLTIQVLTIHGTKDRNAPYGAGRDWARKLPNARLITIPGAAHQTWTEHPDLVFGSIDEFLKGRWPSRANKIHPE